jgi:hypothetical protein
MYPLAGGFIVIINMASTGSLIPADSLLTEAGDPILWEDGNFALTE